MIPRKARAQSTTRAQQLLIIYCQGGMRSNALFTYQGAPVSLCPFGVEPVPPLPQQPAQFALASSAPKDVSIAPPFTRPDPLPSWGANLGNMYSAQNQYSILSPVDHNPGGAPIIDMNIARNLIGTGSAKGGLGLLTIIGNAVQRDLPPFVIGDPALIFAGTKSGYEAGAPVYVRDPLDIYGRINSHPGKGALGTWESTFQTKLDARQEGLAATFLGHPIAEVAHGRAQLELVRQRLVTPQFQFGQSTNANAAYQTSHGFDLTNLRLEQAFLPFKQYPTGGNTPNSDYSDPLGAKMALAVRALQYGSPAVAVGYNGWNLHKNEKTGIQAVSVPLGRAIASLIYILSGMAGTVAKRKIDEVMVVVVSECARDNVLPDTGFNDQNGSDYRGTNPSRFQSLPIFGAGIAGGKVYGGLSASPDLSPVGKVYSSAQLGATMLGALGVDNTPFFTASTIDEIFT